MLKLVQHLIKSRPNSLSLGKSWEVALVSLVPQGFKIPLQSEDTALFQRDWDLYSVGCPIPAKLSEDTALFQRDWDFCNYTIGKRITKSEDTALFQRDWDKSKASKAKLKYSSEDTALFQRDWDLLLIVMQLPKFVGRHCPVPKGLRPISRYRSAVMRSVGRHCPVPKGLRQCKNFHHLR